MASPSMPRIDEDRLNAFMGQAVNDMGAAMHAVLVYTGDRLGLYKAMASAGPITAAELASNTGTDERYIREWLNANAAAGYIRYDSAAEKYSLPPEQSLALAVETSPVFLGGAFQIIAACFRDQPKIEEAFRTGRGVGWHEHDGDLFCGTERFFRTSYAAHLISAWIPALTGVDEKAPGGRSGCRRGVRSRGVNGPDGSSLPEIKFRRVRLSSCLGRRRQLSAPKPPVLLTVSALRSLRRRVSPARATTW